MNEQHFNWGWPTISLCFASSPLTDLNISNDTNVIFLTEMQGFLNITNKENSQPKSIQKHSQCKYIFHKKCQQNFNVDSFVCNFCRKQKQNKRTL